MSKLAGLSERNHISKTRMNKVALYKIQGAEVEKGLARFLGLYVLFSVDRSCCTVAPSQDQVLGGVLDI